MFIRKNAAVIFRFGNRTTCHAFRPWLAPNRSHAPLLCAEIAASPLAKDAWTDVEVPPAARKIFFRQLHVHAALCRSGPVRHPGRWRLHWPASVPVPA